MFQNFFTSFSPNYEYIHTQPHGASPINVQDMDGVWCGLNVSKDYYTPEIHH